MKCIWSNKKPFLLLGIFLAGLSGCGENHAKVFISPTTVTVPTDQRFQFTVEVTDTQATSVTWCILDTTGVCVANTDYSRGFINTTGLYTPPAVIPTPNTVTIRVVNTGNSGVSDTAVVTLVSGNMLRFGTNTKITEFPSGTAAASTLSSGQHSIRFYQTTQTIYTIWADNRNDPSPTTCSPCNYDIFFAMGTLNANGTIPFGADIRVNDDTGTADQTNPSLAVDTSGNVYVAWQDDRNGNNDIFFAKSTDGGTTWSANVQVNDDTGTANQTNPSLAVDTSGNVYVAWQDDRNGNNDIFFAKSTDGGTTWSANVQVNDDTGTADQTNPSLAVDTSGNVYVAWQDDRNGNNDIFFAKSTDGGTTWSANVQVNDDTGTANQTNPSLAVDTSGNVYVAWQDDRNGNNDIFFAKSTDGGTTWSANVQVNDDTGTADQTNPSLAVDTSGNVYVAWQDDRYGGSGMYDIITAKSLDGGSTFWINSLPADHDSTERPTLNPNITVDDFGRAYLIWAGNSGTAGVFFAIGQ